MILLSVVSQYMSAPTVDHWAVVEQILCLKGASGRGILYNNYGHNRIECFSEADWAGSKEDRRSISGYCVCDTHPHTQLTSHHKIRAKMKNLNFI